VVVLVNRPSQNSLEVLDTIHPLQAEWSELADQGRSVFQTWEWVANWWRHFGRNRELRVTTIRSDGRIVGIVPLYLWAARPLRILRFLGHGPSDELGPVVAAAHRPTVAQALPAVLAQFDWDLFLAEQLPADQGWSTSLAGRRILREASPVLGFGDEGWEGFLRTRSRNLREQVRRRERKLAREHRIRYRLADGAGQRHRRLPRLGAENLPAAVVSNNLPGKPLVYNGQETGLDHRLDDGVRVTTQPDFAESAHRRTYATLLRLYRESEALSRGQYTELQTTNTAAVFAFARRHGTDTVLTIVNLSAARQTASLDLGGFEGRYTDVFTGARTRIKSTLKRQLEPWGYQVLRRTG
jgi:Maltogenic Amylase, C-terminal domain